MLQDPCRGAGRWHMVLRISSFQASEKCCRVSQLQRGVISGCGALCSSGSDGSCSGGGGADTSGQAENPLHPTPQPTIGVRKKSFPCPASLNPGASSSGGATGGEETCGMESDATFDDFCVTACGGRYTGHLNATSPGSSKEAPGRSGVAAGVGAVAAQATLARIG